MKLIFKFLLLVCVVIGIIFSSNSFVTAQKSLKNTQVKFNSFTGIYHLSRDSKGLSLLTTEETIVAEFPGSGDLYGIKRALPTKYQNRDINIKILNVSDAAGSSVPYKTAEDDKNNLVITTGDPNITLFGVQTIKIRYQTSGVINLGQKSDEFLLNINGRGWDSPFDSINATLYVPASFKANIKDEPTCYISLNESKNNNCELNVQKSSESTIITSKAKSLLAHQALILKLNFKPATFTNNHAYLSKSQLLIIGIAAILFLSIAALLITRRKK